MHWSYKAAVQRPMNQKDTIVPIVTSKTRYTAGILSIHAFILDGYVSLLTLRMHRYAAISVYLKTFINLKLG